MLSKLIEAILSRAKKVLRPGSPARDHVLKGFFKDMARAIESIGVNYGGKHFIVKQSVGKGRYAKCPYVAVLDSRETTSMETGVYLVFLFREDMSGVYLAFAQGVNDLRKTRRKDYRDVLSERAAKIRETCAHIREEGFLLDDTFDLRARGLGEDYRRGVIAHKLYPQGSIPDDSHLETDLKFLLTTYTGYVESNIGPPPIANDPVKTAESQIAIASEQKPAERLDLSQWEPALKEIAGELRIDETVLHQVVTALKLGKHVILTGPPGTGKSTLAKQLCTVAQKDKLCEGRLAATATADWTTFDTIGGYFPSPIHGLVFNPGLVLQALATNKWLTIDEINRTDIDKAFGALLTILSGDATALPYASPMNPNQLLHVVPGKELYSAYQQDAGEYRVGSNWRLIGTMNTYDKNALFPISLAVTRRFAMIYVPIPAAGEILPYISAKYDVETSEESLLYLLSSPKCPRPLGPAILLDVAHYLNRAQATRGKALLEALTMFVLPQLAGLPERKIVEFSKAASDILGGSLTVKLAHYVQELLDVALKRPTPTEGDGVSLGDEN
jgi:MoxR-like ATPase